LTGEYDLEELKKRDDYFIIGMRHGRVFLKSGDEGRSYSKILLPDLSKHENEIEGQIAKMGFVYGKAYVIHWNAKDIIKEMNDMPKGSILVVGQTRPQLMPAIRKAAAIVTDEGGITSHAAIVSRELGIPCVIGTKVATKIIKTGDLIEVDANNGKVRIIERAKQ
jgi:phosphohistidine swiveling domain-containing protein